MLVSISAASWCCRSGPVPDGSGDVLRPLAMGDRPAVDRFCVYAIDKERHLQKLSRLLTDERVSPPLERLHELSLLLGRQGDERGPRARRRVGRDPAQRAQELLAGASGSVMLVDGESLVARCVPRQPRRARPAGGDGRGIAGRVAQTREPLLINGPTSREFPGLDARTLEVSRRDVGPARASRSAPRCAQRERGGRRDLQRVRSSRAEPVRGARARWRSCASSSTPSAPTSSSSSSSTG